MTAYLCRLHILPFCLLTACTTLNPTVLPSAGTAQEPDTVLSLPQTDPWSKRDIILQAAVAAAFLLDAGQTLDIKNHAGFYEKNKILGKHPADTQIKGYFIGAFLLHTAVIHYTPSEYRPYLQGITLLYWLDAINGNSKIGLRIDF